MHAHLLIAFVMTLAQFTLSCALGGMCGYVLSGLLNYNRSLAQLMIRFLGIGYWAPLYLYAALPLWPVRPTLEPQEGLAIIFWPAWVTAIATIPAVSLCSLYQSLLVRTQSGLLRTSALKAAKVNIVIYTSLVVVLSQLWITTFGWLSFLGSSVVGSAGATLGILIVALLVYILIRRFFPNFSELARNHAKVFETQLSNNAWSIAFGGISVLISIIFFWYLLATTFPNYNWHNVGLFDLVKIAFAWVTAAGDARIAETNIWIHFLVSLLELGAGLLGTIAIWLLISSLELTNASSRKFKIQASYFTWLFPLAAIGILSDLGVLTGSLQTSAVITSLTLFPFVRLYQGFADKKIIVRVLFALEDALPFGFVGLFFGETMSAVAGLGFVITTERASFHVAEAIGAAFLMYIIFVILSALLRSIAIEMLVEKHGSVTNLNVNPQKLD
jgi:hypothetical protein